MRPVLMLTLMGLLSSITPTAAELSTKKELLTTVREYRKAHEHAIVEELFEFVSIPNTVETYAALMMLRE